MRSDGGWNRNGDVPEDQWDGMMLEAFKRCADFLEEYDVRIALDNHGISTNDGDWQLSLIERGWLGPTRRQFGYHELSLVRTRVDQIDRFYEILAPHVFHTHIKDGTGSRQDYKGAALGEGEIHLDHAVKCLKATGYDGAWTAEYEGRRPRGRAGYEKCYQWLVENVS